jgi:hypothetical protein
MGLWGGKKATSKEADDPTVSSGTKSANGSKIKSPDAKGDKKMPSEGKAAKGGALGKKGNGDGKKEKKSKVGKGKDSSKEAAEGSSKDGDGASNQGGSEDKGKGKFGGFFAKLGLGSSSSKPEPSEEAPESSSSSSSTTTGISPNLEEKPSEKTSRDLEKIVDNIMYMLCCMYCRPPTIEPEETPEEREERVRKEKIQAARKKELERLLQERDAKSIKTVLYIEGDLDGWVPAQASADVSEEATGSENLESTNKQDTSDGNTTADDTKAGDVDATEQINKASEEKEKPDYHPRKVGRKSKKKTKKKKEDEPLFFESVLLSYSVKTSNKHSYKHIVSKSPPVRIRISSLHTPAHGASEFVNSLMSFVLDKGGWHETTLSMSAAALKMQLAFRTSKAHDAVRVRKAEREKELAVERENFLKEKQLWNQGFARFTEICKQEARRVAHSATTYWRIPAASVTISRHFRGYRVRKRFPNYRLRVLAQRKRRLERSRYLAALDLVYTGRRDEIQKRESIARLQYSRKGKDGFNDARGGWKPNYETKEQISIWDHIWEPPEGSNFGLRTLKVKLPPRTEIERKIAAEDHNAWLAVPVMVTEKKKKGERLGPPGRPNLNTMRGFEHIKSTIPKPRKKQEVGESRSSEDVFYQVKYTWIPGNFVKSRILDEGSGRTEELLEPNREEGSGPSS